MAPDALQCRPQGKHRAANEPGAPTQAMLHANTSPTEATCIRARTQAPRAWLVQLRWEVILLGSELLSELFMEKSIWSMLLELQKSQPVTLTPNCRARWGGTGGEVVCNQMVVVRPLAHLACTSPSPALPLLLVS